MAYGLRVEVEEIPATFAGASRKILSLFGMYQELSGNVQTAT